MLTKITEKAAEHMLGIKFVHFPKVVLKWTDYEDTRLILNLCRNRKKILELGTHWGYTTENIAKYMPLSTIHTIDVVQGMLYVDTMTESSKKEVLTKEESGIKITSQNVTKIISNTSDFFARSTEKYDCIFIDANHEEKAVLRDSLDALSHLSSRGIIIWHDVYNHDNSCSKCAAEPVNDGVAKALNQLEIPTFKIDKSWIAFAISSQ